MKTWMRCALCAVMVLALATGGWAQLMGVPGTEGTLTVTVSGFAAADPDWVDVNLPIAVTGATAEAALMSAQDGRERIVNALVKAGVKPAQIKTSVTQVSSSTPQPWEQQQAGGPSIRYNASSAVRVRIIPDGDTLYSDICLVLDSASAGGAPQAPGAPGVSVISMVFGGGQNSVVFGVDDEDALTAAALGNALDQAKKVAETAATKSGKTLGDLIAMQLMPPSQSGIMAMMSMVGGATVGPEYNGKATTSVMVSVTYKLR